MPCGRAELGYAKRLASRLGVNLSGFITDAVRQRVLEQQRREAALEVLASFSPHDRATPAETQELLERWDPSPPPTCSDLELLRDAVPAFALLSIEHA